MLQNLAYSGLWLKVTSNNRNNKKELKKYYYENDSTSGMSEANNIGHYDIVTYVKTLALFAQTLPNLDTHVFILSL